MWGKKPFVQIWESQYKIYLSGIVELNIYSFFLFLNSKKKKINFYIKELLKKNFRAAVVDEIEFESSKEEDILKRELT